MHAWWACCVRACMVGRPPWSSFSGHATRPRWPTLHPRYLRPQKAPRDVRHMFGHQGEQAQHAGWIPDFLLEFLKIWLATSAPAPILSDSESKPSSSVPSRNRFVIVVLSVRAERYSGENTKLARILLWFMLMLQIQLVQLYTGSLSKLNFEHGDASIRAVT